MTSNVAIPYIRLGELASHITFKRNKWVSCIDKKTEVQRRVYCSQSLWSKLRHSPDHTEERKIYSLTAEHATERFEWPGFPELLELSEVALSLTEG